MRRDSWTLVILPEQYKVHTNPTGQLCPKLQERVAELFATAAEKHDASFDVM